MTHIPVSAWLAEAPETIATAVELLNEQAKRQGKHRG